MFSNTKTRDVRKFSRKPQSKFVASRRSRKLKRRDEIETKYTDERFVAFTTTDEASAEVTVEANLYNLEIIDQTIAELEGIYNSINGNENIIINQNYTDNITYILEKY